MDNKDKIKKLVDELNDANYKYYVLNSPTMSDFDFDMKMKELEKLEKDENYVLPYSPTQRIGSDLQDDFKDITRNRIMGSIANVYDIEDLEEWLERFRKDKTLFILEPKYDGTSCSLIYKNGILESASTRGDGYTGSDITENVKTIKNIPLILSVNDIDGDKTFDGIEIPEILEFRGEIMMPKSVFNELNEERKKKGLSLFANERNAAAGSLKQLDPKVTAERKLIFKPYGAFSDDVVFTKKYLKYQHSALDLAKVLGFDSVSYWNASTPEEVIDLLFKFEKDFLYNQDYCMDGCVIKVQSISQQDKLGYTQKVPKWAKAFKFKQEQASTKLKDVELQIGMSGQISFVGILEPIEVDGSEISKVTLNNMDYIHKLDIHIGDYVFIQKNGAVIPGVVGVDYSRNVDENVERIEIKAPDKCPFCGGVLTKKEDGVHYYCMNKDCKEKVIQRINHFCKKECMNINGISQKIIRRMYDLGLVNKWQDLYNLTVEHLIEKGFGEKVSQNIIDEICKSKETTLAYKVLMSLGIPMVGKVTSQKIMENVKSFESLKIVTFEEISVIDGVGDVAAHEFVNYIHNNISEIDDVIRIFDNIDVFASCVSSITSGNINTSVANKVVGRRFLATGSLSKFTRQSIIESVESHGGKYVVAVGPSLDYLIVGEKPGAFKIKKAKEYNINIISEDDYINMISNV